MRQGALARTATLGLAAAPGGPARLLRARAAALRAVLGGLVTRRHLVDVLAALDRRAPAVAAAGADRRVVDALRRWPVSCLWRALAAFAALRARGAPVTFVIGVRAGDDRLDAHAWLEVEGAPLAEPEDPRARFAVAFVHPAPAPAHPEGRMATSPDVILTELQDGTGVLLHLGTKFYYALNRSGVVAWKQLAKGATDPDALARVIAAEFAGVSAARARADVEALLAELRAEGLLPGGG